ncbi:unnamed protein product [Cuscuta campestris]|uniref:Uncharacterized protein n=1 Tax=Cuscuta campestris TaxID=132261 RepID=A0A484L3F2_9ASTE|nr:unnamed protein product [Cuscuta campestris]
MIEQIASAATAVDDASYSLMRSGDGVAACKQKLAAVKVEDRYVKVSSKHVEIYSVAPDNILTDLKRNGKKVVN